MRKRASVTVLKKSRSSVDEENPPLTGAELAKLKPVSLVKQVRWKLGLTQVEFAKKYSIAPGTLRDWEQGQSHPDALEMLALMEISRNPERAAKDVRKLMKETAEAD